MNTYRIDKLNNFKYTDLFQSKYNNITIQFEYIESVWSNNGIYKLFFFNDIHILLFELKLSYDTFIDLYYHLEDYLSFNCTYCLSYEFYSDNNKYFFTLIPTTNSHDTDTEIYELCILQNCISSNNTRIKLHLSYDELIDFIIFIETNLPEYF